MNNIPIHKCIFVTPILTSEFVCCLAYSPGLQYSVVNANQGYRTEMVKSKTNVFVTTLLMYSLSAASRSRRDFPPREIDM